MRAIWTAWIYRKHWLKHQHWSRDLVTRACIAQRFSRDWYYDGCWIIGLVCCRIWGNLYHIDLRCIFICHIGCSCHLGQVTQLHGIIPTLQAEPHMPVASLLLSVSRWDVWIVSAILTSVLQLWSHLQLRSSILTIQWNIPPRCPYTYVTIYWYLTMFYQYLFNNIYTLLPLPLYWGFCDSFQTGPLALDCPLSLCPRALKDFIILAWILLDLYLRNLALHSPIEVLWWGFGSSGGNFRLWLIL